MGVLLECFSERSIRVYQSFLSVFFSIFRGVAYSVHLNPAFSALHSS